MKLWLNGFCLAAMLAGTPTLLLAQWPAYPTARVPKTADGKPDLNAPAPRTPDGKVDFSGIWQNQRGIATTLLNASGLGLQPLFQILDDEDASSYHFDAAGFRWRDASVATADIVAQRRLSMISFGSCSFDEPREDLRALRWL